MVFDLYIVFHEIILNGKYTLLVTPGHCTINLKFIMNGCENSDKNTSDTRTRGHEATLHYYLQIV